jgi:hypothetical protein
MPARGRGLQPFDVQRILNLLATTDMSMAQIAERMGCSTRLIAAINRRYEVRDYGGCRTRWMLNIKEGTWWTASI